MLVDISTCTARWKAMSHISRCSFQITAIPWDTFEIYECTDWNQYFVLTCVTFRLQIPHSYGAKALVAITFRCCSTLTGVGREATGKGEGKWHGVSLKKSLNKTPFSLFLKMGPKIIGSFGRNYEGAPGTRFGMESARNQALRVVRYDKISPLDHR